MKERSRRETKGADSAKGGHKMHEGENKMWKSARHKS